jgi:hypothetical protein
MPNIIEQQDLLKGLPDNRLALLLQQPTGDIPPFLVAAEAQRRQSIRAQFSGNANNESVVDSLTKQLVPQNIQAPVNAPPQIPPTPPMAGVAALQQQQAMQQAAMNAQQPQMMRAGGAVRRFNTGGFSGFGDFYGPAPENSAEQIARTYMFMNPGMTYEEAMQRASIGADLPRPTVGQIAEANAGKVGMTGVGNYSILRNPNKEQEDPAITESVEGVKKPDISKPLDPFSYGMTGDDRRSSGGRTSVPAPEAPPQPQPGETEDDFRARIEALYSGAESSDWEKAQRWFAMSEQFLDPSKTTMQSIAGAGRAFAEQSAAMDAGRRENQVEREKALLQYDMSERTREQNAIAEAAKAERERTSMSAESYGNVLSRRLDAIDRIIDSKQKAMAEDMLSSPESRAAAEKEIQELNTAREQVAGLLFSLGETAYGPIPFDTYNLGKGFAPK